MHVTAFAVFIVQTPLCLSLTSNSKVAGRYILCRNSTLGGGTPKSSFFDYGPSLQIFFLPCQNVYLIKFWIQFKFEVTDWSSLMRGIQKCSKMGLMVKNVNVRAIFFEKGAFPKCPVYCRTLDSLLIFFELQDCLRHKKWFTWKRMVKQ